MFGGITHVIENPKGHSPGWNYSLVGSVPISMMLPGRNGSYLNRRWETIEQILEESAKHPEVKLCSALNCACRKLFTVEGASVTAPHTELSELCRDGATAARIAAAQSVLREEFIHAQK